MSSQYKLGTLTRTLNCIFGLGKDFRNEVTTTAEVGCPVLERFDRDGWHKFVVLENGRRFTYAVRKPAELDDALGE